MSEAKTQPTSASVSDFIAAVPDERLRVDGERLRDWMERAIGSPAVITKVLQKGDHRIGESHAQEVPLTLRRRMGVSS